MSKWASLNKETQQQAQSHRNAWHVTIPPLSCTYFCWYTKRFGTLQCFVNLASVWKSQSWSSWVIQSVMSVTLSAGGALLSKSFFKYNWEVVIVTIYQQDIGVGGLGKVHEQPLNQRLLAADQMPTGYPLFLLRDPHIHWSLPLVCHISCSTIHFHSQCG